MEKVACPLFTGVEREKSIEDGQREVIVYSLQGAI